MTTNDLCRDARQTMVNLRPRFDEDATLMMVVEGMIAVEEEHFPDRASFEAAAHIEACDACQRWSADWLDGQFPVRVAYRERLSRYCCQQMYHAATNPDAEVRFAFEMFRGEDPSWSINERYAFARFCPWCGQELPNRAFEPEPNA